MPLLPDRSDRAAHPDRRSGARQPRSARRARDCAQYRRLDSTARPPPLRFGRVRMGEGGLRRFHLNKSRSIAPATQLRFLHHPSIKGVGHTSLPMPATFIPSFSLPLMGIGNARYVDAGGGDLVDLITPHGDRKHELDFDRRLRAEGLITPHGDRKLDRFADLSRVLGRLLITHHGDRKRERGDRGPRSRPGGRHLITPHGDRKRSAWTTCATCSMTHYPSWGSETSGVTFALQVCEYSSLPLMGIGNAKYMAQIGETIEISLPLMGIGNTLRAMRGAVWQMLSLPLMGIGNLARHGDPPGAGGLITPHGDRKHQITSSCPQPS